MDVNIGSGETQQYSSSSRSLIELVWGDGVTMVCGQQESSGNSNKKQGNEIVACNEQSMRPSLSDVLFNGIDEIVSDSEDEDYVYYEGLSDSECEDYTEGSSDDDVDTRHDQLRRKYARRMEKRKVIKKKIRGMVRRNSEFDVEGSSDDGPWCARGELDTMSYVVVSDDENNPVERVPHPQLEWYDDDCNKKEFNLTVGMVFEDAVHFREALRDWGVRRGMSFKWVNNKSDKITVKCQHIDTRGCTFHVHASIDVDYGGMIVKSMRGEHYCGHRFDTNIANYSYLGKRVVKFVRDNKNISVGKLREKIMTKYKVSASRKRVRMAKSYARVLIEGNHDEQFAQLRDYGNTVLVYNPGSRVTIFVDQKFVEPVFDRIFYSLEAMKNMFLVSGRPIIGLDGCFLKSKYGGQLLCAIGTDGNDKLLPIAFAIVSIENKDNWSWFLRELHHCIGTPFEKNWLYISDRQKGLCEVFSSEYEGVHHRHCVRHLVANFRKKFNSVTLIKLMWKAAMTANMLQFQRYMKLIAREDPKVDGNETAYEWLSSIPPEQWTRSHFPLYGQCETLTNNACESFNALIIEDRELPVISLLESLRTKYMIEIESRTDKLRRSSDDIASNVRLKMGACKSASQGWSATSNKLNEYEVTSPGGQQKVVFMDKRWCTCGMFQLCGYPCEHAYAAINTFGLRENDYVSHCYTKEALLRIYEYAIHPVPGAEDYISSGLPPLLPPIVQKKTGRPAKKRRRGFFEMEKDGKLTRQGKTITCNNCWEKGHNKKYCKNRSRPKPPKKKHGAAANVNCNVNPARTTSTVNHNHRNEDSATRDCNQVPSVSSPSAYGPMPQNEVPVKQSQALRKQGSSGSNSRSHQSTFPLKHSPSLTERRISVESRPNQSIQKPLPTKQFSSFIQHGNCTEGTSTHKVQNSLAIQKSPSVTRAGISIEGKSTLKDGISVGLEQSRVSVTQPETIQSACSNSAMVNSSGPSALQCSKPMTTVVDCLTINPACSAPILKGSNDELNVPSEIGVSSCEVQPYLIVGGNDSMTPAPEVLKETASIQSIPSESSEACRSMDKPAESCGSVDIPQTSVNTLPKVVSKSSDKFGGVIKQPAPVSRDSIVGTTSYAPGLFQLRPRHSRINLPSVSANSLPVAGFVNYRPSNVVRSVLSSKASTTAENEKHMKKLVSDSATRGFRPPGKTLNPSVQLPQPRSSVPVSGSVTPDFRPPGKNLIPSVGLPQPRSGVHVGSASLNHIHAAKMLTKNRFPSSVGPQFRSSAQNYTKARSHEVVINNSDCPNSSDASNNVIRMAATTNQAPDEIEHKPRTYVSFRSDGLLGASRKESCERPVKKVLGNISEKNPDARQ